MVLLAGAVAGLMDWYYSPKRVEERWLRSEEQWLREATESMQRANKWLEEHRTPAVDEWVRKVNTEWDAGRQRKGNPPPTGEEVEKKWAARSNYQGNDEEVREWLKREKERDELGDEFNRRVPIWIDKGGDGHKVTVWEQEIKRKLEGG
jgi:hypothetical protein